MSVNSRDTPHVRDAAPDSSPQGVGNVSVNSLTSYVWPQPFASRSGAGATGDTSFTPSVDNSGAAQSNSAAPWFSQVSTATGSVSPFQQLAADVQAVLAESQQSTAASPAAGTTGAGTASTSTATSTTGGTSVTDPAQRLAAEVQSIFAQMQGNGSGSNPGAQDATSSGQTDPTTQVEPHHHHHRHHGGGEPLAGGPAAVGGSTLNSSVASTPGTSATNTVASASKAFAADIVQALQAYAGTAASTATSGVTV
jgi:hypothetical protein